MSDYLTLTRLSHRLGRPRQLQLMRYLVREAGVEVIRVDERQEAVRLSDVPAVRAALSVWDNRPRMSREPASVAS